MWLVIGSGCYDGWLLTLYTLSVITMHTQILTYSWSPKYAFLNRKFPPQIFRWSDSISAILGFDIIWETRRQVKWPSNLSHNNQLKSYNPVKNTFDTIFWPIFIWSISISFVGVINHFLFEFSNYIPHVWGAQGALYIFLNFGPMNDMSKLTIGHPFFNFIVVHCLMQNNKFLKVSHCMVAP